WASTRCGRTAAARRTWPSWPPASPSASSRWRGQPVRS
ncbi:MAG: hypothetical protein AVDCRST_MAG20-2340, partial [uncultured Acidimicrobiales bacterium]